MTRQIIILGFAADQRIAVIDDDFGKPGNEIWTLNDWWAFYPRLKRPDRVYQIHRNYNGVNENVKKRNWPDWRERYDASGAEIVTIQDFGLARQRLFDFPRGAKEFGGLFLGSTIGYMFADAIWEGVSRVELVGVKLERHGEYEFQLPSVIHDIKIARERGIVVEHPREAEWRTRSLTVDWAKLKSVECFYG